MENKEDFLFREFGLQVYRNGEPSLRPPSNRASIAIREVQDVQYPIEQLLEAISDAPPPAFFVIWQDAPDSTRLFEDVLTERAGLNNLFLIRPKNLEEKVRKLEQQLSLLYERTAVVFLGCLSAMSAEERKHFNAARDRLLGLQTRLFFVESVADEGKVRLGFPDVFSQVSYDCRLFQRAGEKDLFERKFLPAREETGDNPPEVLWSRLHDETANVSLRVEALSNFLFNTSEGEAVSYLAKEILRQDLSEEWRNALVFLAEDVHFPESTRKQVGERLLSIARELRLSKEPGIEKVVWSAMRRAVTLIPLDPERMMPFLNRDEFVVDTRSIALLCVERMFELAPPETPETFKGVADRVAAFAFKFLDPDVFASGENAVIAKNAVCALAALSDPRLSDALATIKSLGRRWMNYQIRDRLQQLLESWRSQGDAVVSHPAIRKIEELLPYLA